MKRAPASESQRGKMREKAYLYIQKKIVSRELSAGTALSEPALARELGTSRTPIREAIGQLVAEGLLEQHPNRGAVVVQLTRQDVIDLFELREALEVYSVGKPGRPHLRDAELHRLQEFADELLGLREELAQSGAATLNGEQMHRMVSADLGFHTVLIRAGGNARILKVVNETRLLIRILEMRRRGHNSGELEEIHRQHSLIVSALAADNRPHAMEVLSQHIQTSLRERLDEFDYWEREEALRSHSLIFSR